MAERTDLWWAYVQLAVAIALLATLAYQWLS